MTPLPCISPDLTVRQVVSAFPACASMLRFLPSARQRDQWTLQQLGPFARQAGRDEQSLLQELARTAGVPVRSRADRSPRSRSPMPLIFAALAVGISLGTAYGVGLLLRIASGARWDNV